MTVAEEISRLLAEMRNSVQTVDDVRETTEIGTIVRQMVLPALSADAPPSLIPAVARATLLGAWVQYAARRA